MTNWLFNRHKKERSNAIDYVTLRDSNDIEKGISHHDSMLERIQKNSWEQTSDKKVWKKIGGFLVVTFVVVVVIIIIGFI